MGAPRMNFGGVVPVLWRELQEGARRPFNYWLRSTSAGVGLFLLFTMTGHSGVSNAEVGARLFAGIHILLVVMICCLVPSMTADCISSENREGTLSLLFLTSLTAGGIVVGKAAMQALRTFTMWIALVPVLIIPFLLGGLTMATAQTAITIEFCLILLCLAAGLLASSLTKSRTAAMVLALVFGESLVALFGHSMLVTIAPLLKAKTGDLTITSVLTGSFFGETYGHRWNFETGLWSLLETPLTKGVWVETLVRSVSEAVVVFIGVIFAAAWCVERAWKDKPRSVRQESLFRRYCIPIFKNWFSRRKRRALKRNPMAWLQMYSWKTRAFRLVLCLAVIVVETSLLGAFNKQGYGGGALKMGQISIFLAMGIVFSFVGVNSFLKEKETRTLELILVSPLSVNQIILGQVFGLWKQFFPAAVVFGVCYAAIRRFLFYYAFEDETWLEASLMLCAFFSLPFFTTYFALCLNNVPMAVALSVITVILPPILVWPIVNLPRWGFEIDWSSYFGCVSELYGALVIATYLRINRNLRRRTYAF
jgi:ABC-type transport system involved in multi-copper enzyme maturation permease subunit